MENKQTLAQELHSRKLHRPPFLFYRILMIVIWVWNKMIHTSFTYKVHPGEDKEPFVIISNHASRCDYLFTAPVCLPRRLNYVVGYNEFLRFPLNIVLKWMNAVPKKNFTPDFYCVRQIMSIIKQGGCICIMPEGMSSITGMAQPVIPGGAKLLKRLGVTVYFTRISGGYLTYTKHCLDSRPGRVDVTVDRMFTPEELSSMTESQIEERMNYLLAHDDYIWNKEEQVSFRGKGEMAKNLDTLLYLCPKCGSMYSMECSGDTMRCEECGNTIEIDDKYNIKAADENSICPELVTDWTIMERENAAEFIKNEDFSYSGNVEVGILPEYKLLKGDNTSIRCGHGRLTLTKDGLNYEGTIDGKDENFTIAPKELPTFGMCTDISRFYTFYEGRFIEFYPENNDVLRWFHLAEELHRASGGKWQNTPYRDTKI